MAEMDADRPYALAVANLLSNTDPAWDFNGTTPSLISVDTSTVDPPSLSPAPGLTSAPNISLS